MTASYPGNSATGFSTKVDGTDFVLAAHVNLLQEEVLAIQNILGANPHITSSTAMSSLSFDNSFNNAFSTVKARLENIEAGLYKAQNSSYVLNAGGSTIVPSVNTTKGLVVKGASSQSANLQEWQTSAGTAKAYVDNGGNLVDPNTQQTLNNLYVLNVVFG
jgi:hypothetical protein